RRTRPDGTTLAALVGAATPLVSPFLLDYDLTLTALPLAWLVARGARAGFAPWEKLAALAVYVWPLVGRAVAGALHLPLAPLLVAA
ncbi:hypothetical protein J8J40_30565, partial [Mycobacterium tuberculosis]|nr:hypothetical protein [Mycobacterium tuberculosis]